MIPTINPKRFSTESDTIVECEGFLEDTWQVATPGCGCCSESEFFKLPARRAELLAAVEAQIKFLMELREKI
jgi:hypothetical protein